MSILSTASFLGKEKAALSFFSFFFFIQHSGVTIKAQLNINYSAQILVQRNNFYILTINFSFDSVGIMMSKINTHIPGLCHIFNPKKAGDGVKHFEK